MNETLTKLTEQGCNIPDALYRIGNDEDFLLTCIRMTLDDANFAALGAGIAEGNVTKAFEAAHSLKGLCANTGMNPLTGPAVEITEILRAGSLEGVEPLYADLMSTHAALKQIVG